MEETGNNTIEGWLMQAAPDAMLIVDASGRVVQANALAETLFGYAKGGLNGQSVESLIPEPLRDRHRQHRRQYSGYPRTRPMGTGLHLRALRSDGTEFDTEISLSPVSTDTGSVILVAIRDVTTLKRAHETLQRAAEELERAVEARTAELLKVNAELNKQVAERIQAETARRVTEESYRHLVETQPDPICRFLPDTALTFVNAAYAEFFGSTPEELMGKRFTDFLAEAERHQVWSNLAACTPSQPSRQYERRTRRADGAYRIHLWNDLALYDEHGQLIDFQSVGVDVTDRKEAEAKQRAMETKYRHLVEAIPMGMHIYRLEHDARLVFTGANPAADGILGTDHTRFLGQTMEQAFPALAEGPLPEIYRRVAREGCPWHSDAVQYQYGSITGVYEVDAFQTAPDEMAALFSDITKRSRAESALAESARQMTAILDNIPDIAWLKDARSGFIAVNEPFGRACGVSPEDLVGKTDLDIWPEELAHSYRADDQDVMRTGKRKRVEERLMASDGRESWIETVKTPIFNDQGEVIGTTGIARDITERKRAEQALYQEKERAQVTLHSIGDAVITTDFEGRVEYLNPVAEALTAAARHGERSEGA